MRCHPSPLTPPLALEMLNKATRFLLPGYPPRRDTIRPQETPISAADAISDSLGPSPASARCGLADGIHQQVVPLGRSVREPLPLQAGASKSIPGMMALAQQHARTTSVVEERSTRIAKARCHVDGCLAQSPLMDIGRRRRKRDLLLVSRAEPISPVPTGCRSRVRQAHRPVHDMPEIEGMPAAAVCDVMLR